MPADLPQGERVALEQVGYARPVVQQPPDPGQADQPDAELDAARPVHAGQEGVLPPPGAQLVGDPARVLLVMGEEPGGGQQREVLQPGDLPDLLDVADLLLRAVIDAEGVTVGSGPAAGHRVAEPVGLHQVGPDDAQDFPFAAHQPVRAGQNGGLGLRRDTRGGVPAARRRRTSRSPAGGGASAPSCPGLTCRRDHSACSTWSRARQATSAGDIAAARRAYQPSREIAVALIRAPVARSTGSRPRRWSPW